MYPGDNDPAKNQSIENLKATIAEIKGGQKFNPILMRKQLLAEYIIGQNRRLQQHSVEYFHLNTLYDGHDAQAKKVKQETLLRTLQ